VVSYPQLFGFECPAGINFHYFWGCTLAALVVFGSGSISIDDFLLRRLGIDRRRDRWPTATP
jgi:putative oxidoreductase